MKASELQQRGAEGDIMGQKSIRDIFSINSGR
jgi:hypothetical protein